MIDKIINWWNRKNDRIKSLEKLNKQLSKDKDYWFGSYENIQKQAISQNQEIKILENSIKKLQEIFTEPWDNPYVFKVYTGNFYTYNKGGKRLKIPANTFVTKNKEEKDNVK